MSSLWTSRLRSCASWTRRVRSLDVSILLKNKPICLQNKFQCATIKPTQTQIQVNMFCAARVVSINRSSLMRAFHSATKSAASPPTQISTLWVPKITNKYGKNSPCEKGTVAGAYNRMTFLDGHGLTSRVNHLQQ